MNALISSTLKILRVRYSRPFLKQDFNVLAYRGSDSKKWSKVFDPVMSSRLYSRWWMLLMSLLLLKKAANCIDNELEVIKLNKIELVKELDQMKEDTLIIVYNRYQKLEDNQQIKQFCSTCLSLNIKKVFLVEDTDVRHLRQYLHILKQDHNEEDDTKHSQHKQDTQKYEFYFNSTQFPKKMVYISDFTKFADKVAEIREIGPKIYPKDESLEQLLHRPYGNMVIRQCSQSDHACAQSFSEQIHDLVNRQFFEGKQQQYQFVVSTPATISAVIGKNYDVRSLDLQEQANTYILRKDILGTDLSSYKGWLQQQGTTYPQLSRFLMFIKPRIHFLTKVSLNSDLFWYVSCSQVNKQPTVSISNIERMSASQAQSQLTMLNWLCRQFPSLNFVIVDTPAVSQLIRHLYIAQKWVIFNLTPEIPYPKAFLHFDKTKSAEENYETMEAQIKGYLASPKVYDRVVTRNEHEVNIDDVKRLAKSDQPVILRVCKGKCPNNMYPPPVYWIDSQTQNISLQEGDYTLQQGQFQRVTHTLDQ